MTRSDHDADRDRLRTYAADLLEAGEAAVPMWLRRCVADRAPEAVLTPEAIAMLDETAAAVLADLKTLLHADSADQAMGPLQVLRRGVAGPTRVLQQAGVAPVERDEFAERAFPDDVYGLVPASFADIDPSLHDPGIAWGAAKAYVHLQQRRTAVLVVALTRDLMDRSKISAAFPDITVAKSVAAIDSTAQLVLADLQLVDDFDELRAAGRRVIGFASHVDEARIETATSAGIEALPRSVFFRRLAAGDLV